MPDSIRHQITEASAALSSASESPRLDAELLLSHAFSRPRSWLFSHADEPLPDDARAVFSAHLQRRLRGEPIAYILGEQEFWSLTLAVTPDCLVPRADTECLIEWALSLPGDALKVVDLGTGSGAIALALASEKPHWQVTATDVSEAALNVAKRNAQTHRLNIEFGLGNWFEAVERECFDLVVSNPPYIADTDPHLAHLRHEPQSALTSGHDGLDAIRHIAAHAGAHMTPGAYLALEHGYDQGQRVRDILSEQGFLSATTGTDLAGRDRFTYARRSAT